MTPLVSQLWPQFMADPDFAACFGRVVVEHAQMLRQECVLERQRSLRKMNLMPRPPLLGEVAKPTGFDGEV